MNKEKARVIIYSANEAFKKLMFIAISIEDDAKDELELMISKAARRIAAHISYEILHSLFNEYPEIKNEIDMVDKVLLEVYSKKQKHQSNGIFDNKDKARIITYIATSAFSKLGGSLVPHVVSIGKEDDSSKSKLELEVTQAIIEQSGEIILKILKPIFERYPEFEKEINLIHNEFGILPC
jgi:hypothetical protein